jgi:hypothetical protein
MFGTISNTTKLVKISLNVLLRDRDLLYFPLLSAGAMFFVLAYAFIALSAGGAIDRVTSHGEFRTPDFIFLFIAYFGASFVVVYFNTALVAAAHYRLMGGNPDFRFGFEAANDRLGAIVAWAAIAATVGFFLRQLASSNSIFGRVAGFIVEMLWAWATFLVIPVMVVESASPIEAMRRSTEMFKETWGRQLVANFGFGIGYFFVALAALVPAVLLFVLTSSLAVALVVGAILYVLGASLIKAMETVFTVALYSYASSGQGDGDFPDEFLRDAYVYKNEKGKFGPPSMPKRAVA